MRCILPLAAGLMLVSSALHLGADDSDVADHGLALEHWGITEPQEDNDPSASDSVHANPATYPLAEDFAQRREKVVRRLAEEDLARWRRGYFTGGDPGKYLPGAAMAKLLVDPEDEMARRYMNDDRSPREHYHFAAVNWARYIPLFGDTLSEDTMAEFNRRGARYTDYVDGGGTENHKTMQYHPTLVLPWYTDQGLATRNRDDTLAAGKRWIKDYVKNLYQVGMGEWESSTYHAFTINAFLNVYDFAQDPEVRLLAKAALDYYVASYAVKYTDGVLSGPSQRGFSRHSAEAISDTLGWMWWGSSRSMTPDEVRNFRYSSHTWTSGWRPNRILTNIALRNLPELPAEWRNSKSNYWFGLRIEPQGNHFHESLFVDQHFTLGSLWAGWDQHGQTVRWQFSAQGRNGAITLTGGHPVQGRAWDGLGKYEQTAQSGSSLVLMTDIPEDDEYPYTYVHIPEDAHWPERHGEWYIMRANHSWICVHPLIADETLSSNLGFGERSNRDIRRGSHPDKVIHIPGRRSGFVLMAASLDQYSSMDDLKAALDESNLEISHDNEQGFAVNLTTFQGKALSTQQQPGERHARTTIDEQPVLFQDWPVFDGPYYSLENGVLSVNDGENGYRVDFTGDLPVYSDWDPSQP